MTKKFGICGNCGKEYRIGCVTCPYCGSKNLELQVVDDKDETDKGDVVWKNVNKLIICIWVVHLFCGLPFSIISGLIGYYATGPECVNAALKAGRSPNWAFFWGGFFNFVGWGIYWAYLKIVGDI